MADYIGISKPLVVAGETPKPEINYFYGPWGSINEALANIPQLARIKGLTVGIIEGSEIVEYWFKDGVDLVLKSVDPTLVYTTDETQQAINMAISNLDDIYVAKEEEKRLITEEEANKLASAVTAQELSADLLNYVTISQLDEVDDNLQEQINTHESQINIHSNQIQNIVNTYINNKGYFATLTSLQASHPIPEIGDIAYVADALSTTGYYIYNVVDGVWTSSTVEAPLVDVPINDYTLNGGSTKTLKEVDDSLAQLADDILTYNPSIHGIVNFDVSKGIKWVEKTYMHYSLKTQLTLNDDFYSTTPYIYIENYERIEYTNFKSVSLTGIVGFVFFSDKNEESAIIGYPNPSDSTMEENEILGLETVDIPDGAKYVRFSFSSQHLSQFKCKLLISGLEISPRKIIELNKDGNKYIKTDVNIGDIVDLTPLNAISYSRYSIFDCSSIERLIMNGGGGNAGRFIAFLDEDNKLIINTKRNYVASVDEVFIVPENAVICVHNNTISGHSWIPIDDIDNDILYKGNLVESLGDDKHKAISQYGITKLLNGIRKENKYLQDIVITIKNKYQRLGDASALFFPIEDGESKMLIKAQKEVKSVYSFLKSMQNIDINLGLPDFCNGFEQRYEIDKGSSKIIDIPIDCRFIYILNTTLEGSNIYPYLFITDKYIKDEIIIDIYEELDRITDYSDEYQPKDITEYNVKRRSDQFSEIEWENTSPLPTFGSAEGFSVGTHKGLPYSSCMEVDKFIGFDVTIKTFMTALNNPYSLLYTEDILGTRSKSAYGITYNGNNCGLYMGVVCSVFAWNTVGQGVLYNTGSFHWLEKQGILERVYNQSFQGAQLGDIFHQPGHTGVITNIKRDTRGRVTEVTWGESVHDLVIDVKYNEDSFNRRLESGNHTLYRFRDLYKNIHYDASPFIAVDDEEKQTYLYNDDICTFAGDYASFREGQIIVLNYNLKEVGDWDSIEIYKDDVLVNTYPIDTSENSLNLTEYNLAFGDYKARMKVGEIYSDYTYFEIIETNVTHEKLENGFSKIRFSSSNSEPLFVRACSIAGRPYSIYTISKEELLEGEVIYDVLDLTREQNPNSPLEDVYIKVYFQGKYGRVTNEPLLTDLY